MKQEKTMMENANNLIQSRTVRSKTSGGAMSVNRLVSLMVALTTITAASLCSAPAIASTLIAESGPASNTDESWRATKPKLPPPQDFKLAAVKSYKLDNGLKVQFVEDHRYPYITVILGMKTGTIANTNDKSGLAELTAGLLEEGTKDKSSKQISEEIDFIGGSLSAISDYDFTIMSGSCLSNYTDRLFPLMADVFLRPSFPENELKLAKANWIQSLAIKRSDSDFLLDERFRKVVFGEHPYGALAPKPDMINSITQSDLQKFHAANYLPNDSLIIVLGDFDDKKMEELIKTSFGSWAAGERKSKEQPTVAQQTNRRVYLVDRPDSAQSAVVLGNLGIKKKDPDYFAVKVMNQILGGSANSRLFLNIREQKGYTYGAYSSMSARIYPDVFSAGASVRTEVTEPAIKEFLSELDRIRDSSVTKEELDDAKKYLVGQFQLGLETQSGLAQRLLEVGLYDMDDKYLESYTDKYMAVTADDVQRVAKKVIQSKDLVIAVVGDAKKIKPGLEQFGKIELYDLNGELTTLSNPTKEQSGNAIN
ncbi:MAG: pitrilysin family protein [Candidatus Melainabacteria bacterium]|nr:pitrilysin family protein [Candidatus Melainabacteria bacterium]